MRKQKIPLVSFVLSDVSVACLSVALLVILPLLITVGVVIALMVVVGVLLIVIMMTLMVAVIGILEGARDSQAEGMCKLDSVVAGWGGGDEGRQLSRSC